MTRLLLASLALGVLIVGGAVQAQPFGADRDFEPIVLTGSDVSALSAAHPNEVAAFRYDSSGWTRIPSQIDEREYIDYAWAYNGRDGIRCDTTITNPVWCFEFPDVVFGTAYMDDGTFTGPDSDPFVDADDELVFMAKDAGSRAPSNAPPPAGGFGPAGEDRWIQVG